MIWDFSYVRLTSDNISNTMEESKAGKSKERCLSDSMMDFLQAITGKAEECGNCPPPHRR
jgi:hypothetical protein